MNKFLKYLVIFLLISFPVSAEKSKLPKCKGDDYKKWTDCYAKIQFPRIEYEGEWKKGMFHGQGIAKDTNGIMNGVFEKNLMISGKIDFVDGSSYEGTLEKDQFHGFGKYYYSSGAVYEGNWKNGDYHGKGKIIYSDGSIFEGNYENGLKNGFGIYKDINGAYYEGEYKDDYTHGKGKYIWENGDIYEGTFKNGDRTGRGKITMSGGIIYVGEVVKGKKEGFGTTTWPDGYKYIGEYVQGVEQGKGKRFYRGGDIYEGESFKGVEQGLGKMIYGSKTETWKVYEGEWNEGLEEGYGKLIFKNGDKYEGEFEDSRFSGKGKFTWVDGDTYEGEFENGEHSGYGEYFGANGFVYKGGFLNGYYHGKGILISSDGSKYVGNFENHFENGYGEKTFKKDLEGRVSYSGNWKGGSPNGKGKMVYADGSIFEGIFKDGEKIEGQRELAKFTTTDKYYALVIGNNKYKNKEVLEAAANDAKVISNILQDKYGFEVTTLIDADYSSIVDNLIEFTKNKKKTDNLLIYYAGHGELSEDENKGYWLPIDAGIEQDSKWISNDIIRSRIKATNAKHVLLVVDSCFAGSISRGGKVMKKNTERLNSVNIINRYRMKSARLVITSGGNEPVSDTDGGKHSVFANKFIDVLKNNNNVIQSMYLFQNVSDYVINNAQQTPNRTIIHGTGDDGGDFLFFPTG